MIEFKRYGKTVRIANKHWKNFRKRFNPDNAEKRKGDGGFLYKGDFSIEIPCSLCEVFHEVGCERCSFGKFSIISDGEIKEAGCEVFIRKLFKIRYFWTETDKVAWRKDNNLTARKQLKRIQKFMDEIEKEQPPKNIIQLRT